MNLTKKGEASEQPNDMKADMFPGPKPGEVESKSESKASNQKDKLESKPLKTQSKENKSEDKSSRLDRALKEKDTVSKDDLSEGLGKLKLSKESKSQLSLVLSKSVISKTLSLQDMVSTLQNAVPDSTADVVLEALKSLKKKYSDQELVKLVETSGLDMLGVLAAGKKGNALEAFLKEHQLLFLMPVSELTLHIVKLLADPSSSLDAVLAHINKEIDITQSAAFLSSAVGAAMAAAVFISPEKPDLESLSKYSNVIKRVTAQPAINAQAQASILFSLQHAWSDAKMPKGVLKSLFEKLHKNGIIVWEGFDSWKEDRANKTANKPKALVQVNSFLESIKPKELEEGDDEGDEEEAEED